MTLYLSPFSFLSVAVRRQLTPVAIVLAVFMFAHMLWLARPLNTNAAPVGVLSFEFAWSVVNSQKMVTSWGTEGKMLSAFLLGYDFLFPLVYGTAIGLACLGMVESPRPLAPRWAQVGIYLSWGMVAAILLDYIENIALFQILFGNLTPVLPPLAAICAGIKFLLVALGILYVLATGVGVGMAKNGR